MTFIVKEKINSNYSHYFALISRPLGLLVLSPERKMDWTHKNNYHNLKAYTMQYFMVFLIFLSLSKKIIQFCRGSNTLKKCNNLSILGISVPSDQSQNEHISSVAKPAARKIVFSLRSRRFFTPLQLLILYKAQISTCFEYCAHI